MIVVKVKRYQRRKKLGDETSPLRYYLKQVPGTSQIYDLKAIASEIHELESVSAADVKHTVEAVINQAVKKLREGHQVKLNGLGIFHMTFAVEGTAKEEDCTVKSIKRINIRFRPDTTIKLANESTATTRGGDHNIAFQLVLDSAASPVAPVDPVDPIDPVDPEDDPTA